MASHMNALAAYRPRIELGPLVQTPDLSLYIARGTALNRGEIGNVLDELNEAIIFYARQGIPVKINGLGVFTRSSRPTANCASACASTPASARPSTCRAPSPAVCPTYRTSASRWRR